jgi:hypothetical protein
MYEEEVLDVGPVGPLYYLNVITLTFLFILLTQLNVTDQPTTLSH